jgi:hypothetical protein
MLAIVPREAKYSNPVGRAIQPKINHAIVPGLLGRPALFELQKAIYREVDVALAGSLVRYARSNTVTPVDVNWAQKSGSFLHQPCQNRVIAGAIVEPEADSRQRNRCHKFQ